MLAWHVFLVCVIGFVISVTYVILIPFPRTKWQTRAQELALITAGLAVVLGFCSLVATLWNVIS